MDWTAMAIRIRSGAIIGLEGGWQEERDEGIEKTYVPNDS